MSSFAVAVVLILVVGIMWMLGGLVVDFVERAVQRRIDKQVGLKVAQVLSQSRHPSGCILQFGPIRTPIYSAVAVIDVNQNIGPVTEMTLFGPCGCKTIPAPRNVLHTVIGDQAVITFPMIEFVA